MAPRSPSTIDGELLREIVYAGTRCLEANVDAINALNVFPVPDGDTGINMLLTLKAANESPELPRPGTGNGAEVSHALARGALLGARGNSGVIFSQFMKGISTALADRDECDGEGLAAALVAASSSGYQAVGKPVEGTMLTVMRAAAEGAGSVGGPPAEVLRAALASAERALEHTPEQLPVLKEAGVVDAGGQGVVAFLAGALGCLDGTEAKLTIATPEGGLAQAATNVAHGFLEHTEEEMYGYCTQFIVQGEGLDLEAVREQVTAMAVSTVVVGDDRTLRVHAHAEDPGPLLSLGASIGTLDQINIQNMDAQHTQFMARHGYVSETGALAVVAVSPGPGIGRVLTDLGAAALVPGGQTMNPSAAELMDAARGLHAERVVLLPNNPNILMAAQQAAELSDGAVSVVPSRTVPQGIAAMLAFNPDLEAEANLQAMTAAMDSVRSAEVTTAVRSTTIDGIRVEQGQAIALLDGHLAAAAATPAEALLAAVERAAPGEGSLVTLYYGADVDAEAARAAADEVAARFAGVETEVIEGGQPHYHYFVSIE